MLPKRLFARQARADLLAKISLKPFMNGALAEDACNAVVLGTKRITHSKHTTVAGNKNQIREFLQLETVPLLERKPVMGLAIMIAMNAVEALQLILLAFLLRGYSSAMSDGDIAATMTEPTPLSA